MIVVRQDVGHALAVMRKPIPKMLLVTAHLLHRLG